MRLRICSRTLSLLLAGASTLGLAAQAHAQAPQEEPGVGVAEIVVTAQKRSTSLQRTPLAVTALSAEALQQAQVNELEDINGLAPALRFGNANGYAQVTIRGIGINNFVPLAESAVALNLNEVYVSRPVAFLGGLYDVSALEVLRGPQGTLYGRNATAGALNLTTTRPTSETSGYATVTVGNYGLLRLEGAVGGALVEDKVLLRVAGFRETRNGYGTNIVTGEDVDDKDAYGIRGTLVVAPTENLKATLIAEYFDEDDNGAAFHYLAAAGLSGLPGAFGAPPVFQLLGGRRTTDPYDVATRLDSKFKLQTTAITGIVEWNSGPTSLKSITGYRDQNAFNRANIAGGDPGAYVLNGEPADQFSQELQVNYESEGLNLTAGLFYFRETDDYSPGVIVTDNAVLNLSVPAFIPGFSAPPGYTRNFEVGALQKVRAKAVFGEATFDVTDALSITAGIRYSEERKRLYNRFLVDFFTPYTGDFTTGAPPPASALAPRTFKSTTPKLGVQYQVDPRTMLYASYTKGFKSGGFAASAPDALASQGFNPEKVTAFEGGLKTTLWDNRLRLNLSGFHYDYTDLQVQLAIGNNLVTANAASAEIYGAEAEFSALLTPAFTLDGSASWLHARYDRYVGADNNTPFVPAVDFSGRRLNNAPDFQAFIAATYRWDLAHGDLRLRGDLEYSSKFYFTPTNILAAGQDAFAKVNASLTYTDNAGWYGRGFVRNITDETTRTSAFTASVLFGTPISGALAPPRTYGLEFGYRF